MTDDTPVFRPVDKELPQIESEIDTKLLEIRDKIKIQDDIKQNPPKKGELSVEVPEGYYSIDLRSLLLAQLSDCPSTVIPMLIDHGVRTAVDIKEAYKPEKRTIPFHYWWVLILFIGIMVIVYFGLSMFGVF